MPHHWFLIDPDNPGPRQRAGHVRKAARECGGKLIFVGHAKGKAREWYALIELPQDDKLEELRKKVGVQRTVLTLDEVTPEED